MTEPSLPQKLIQHFQDTYGVVGVEQLTPSIEQWFDTPLGAVIRQAEQEILDQVLSNLFGYHLMQLSVDRQANLYGNSKINHCFGLHPLPRDRGCYTGQSTYEQLPIERGSIDVALLHHVIDFAERPHRLLREVVRSVTARGHVVIVGFNPISPLGLSRMVGRYSRRKPHQRSNAIRLGRVIDWLRLLDCEPVRVEQGCFRLPINNQFWLDQSRWFEPIGSKLLKPFGSFYVVVARKDQRAPIMMRPTWQPVKAISGFGGAKIASRMPVSGAAVELKVVTKVDKKT